MSVAGHGRRNIQLLSAGVKEARGEVGQGARRIPGRRQRISDGEFHARELGPGFGRHQITIARVRVAADQARAESATAGGENYGAGTYRPSSIHQPRAAGGTGNRAVGMDDQFQGRVMVEDVDAVCERQGA